MAYLASDYLRAFLALLPRGRIWSRDPDSLAVAVASTLMPTYERQGDQCAALLVDAFPATTQQLLPEWEATLGLPDPCAGPAPTIAQRQANVVAQLIDSGGCSATYYRQIAAALGFQISITSYAAFRFGRNTFGQPLFGSAWPFAWKVTATGGTATLAVLQCELARRAQAHTVLLPVNTTVV